MKYNKKRIIFAIGYIIINITVLITPVKAANIAPFEGLTEYDGNDSSGTPGSGIPQMPIGHVSVDGTGLYEGKKYQCNYGYKISSNSGTSVDAYDFEGNSLMPDNIEQIANKQFKAGTWIGLNITETKSASWEVKNITVAEIKKKYQCNYEKPGTMTCSYDWQYKLSSNSCPSGYQDMGLSANGTIRRCRKTTCRTSESSTATEEIKVNFFQNVTLDDCPKKSGYNKKNIEEIGTTTISVRSGSILDTCEKESVQAVYSSAQATVGTATSLVEYINTNDINKKNTLDTLKPIQTGYTDSGKKGKSGVITKTFKYTPSKVCMNMKTGEVSYKRDCIENEEQIKSTSKYWPYFIPLNATSDSKFYIGLTDNNDGYIVEKACLNAIENTMKDTYQNVLAIKEKNGNVITFTGNYRDDRNKIIKAYKNKGKCYISTKINFNIEQKFYNETKEHKLKGFNFYYKPIDISNPFPNELDKDSYWNGIYDKNNNTVKINDDKKVDLDNSFKNLTYYADVTNLKDIREYNQNNSYSSWDNMYLTGASSFVEEYLTRNVNRDTFYKLGCGPANEGRWHCK